MLLAVVQEPNHHHHNLTSLNLQVQLKGLRSPPDNSPLTIPYEVALALLFKLQLSPWFQAPQCRMNGVCYRATSGKANIDVLQTELQVTPLQGCTVIAGKSLLRDVNRQAPTERIRCAELTQRQRLLCTRHPHVIQSALIVEPLGLHTPTTIKQNDMPEFEAFR